MIWTTRKPLLTRLVEATNTQNEPELVGVGGLPLDQMGMCPWMTVPAGVTGTTKHYSTINNFIRTQLRPWNFSLEALCKCTKRRILRSMMDSTGKTTKQSLC